MGTDKKTQIRIIKQAMAGSIPESQAVSEERQKKDAMAEICSVSGWVPSLKEGVGPIRGSHFKLYLKRLRPLYEKTFSQMPSEASLQPRWSTLEYSIANDEPALPCPVP